MSGITKEVIMRIKAQADSSGKVEWSKVKTELEGVEQAGTKASGMFSSMGAKLAGLAAGYLGVHAAIGLVKSSIHAAVEDETATNRLVGALKGIGVTSEKGIAQYEAFAVAQSRKTLFTKEEIKSAQALLATMGVSAAGMEDATRAALDWASAYDKDLHGAAMLVGRSMEGNIAIFRRYGIEIDDKLSKQEKITLAMGEFARVSGRAGDAAKGLTADISGIGKEWDELTEKIGKSKPVTWAAEVIRYNLQKINEDLDSAKQKGQEKKEKELDDLEKAYEQGKKLDAEQTQRVMEFRKKRAEEEKKARWDKHDQDQAAEEAIEKDRLARKHRFEEMDRKAERLKREEQKRTEEEARALDAQNLARKIRNIATVYEKATQGYGSMDFLERGDVREMEKRLRGPGGFQYYQMMGSEARALAARSGLLGQTLEGFAGRITKEEMPGALGDVVAQMAVNVTLNANDLADQFLEKVIPEFKKFQWMTAEELTKRFRGQLEGRSAYQEMGAR